MAVSISSKASLPSLRVLITSQESNMPINIVNKTKEKNVLSNLLKIEMIKIIFYKVLCVKLNFSF